MAKTQSSKGMNRRAFVVGAGGTAAVGALVAAPFARHALAGVRADQAERSSDFIEIVGRLTNGRGEAHTSAFIEIVHDALPDGTDKVGFWTDDDGTFSVRTRTQSNAPTRQLASGVHKQLDVLFEINTRDGNLTQWNVRLDGNSARTTGTQFVADFAVD